MSARRWITGVAGVLGCLIVLLAFPGILLGAMLTVGSQRTIYERAKSPDGWHEARVQFDDAGAVSGFSRLVFVKHSWNASDEPLLSCRAFWGDGEAKVHLRWLNSSTLVIEHHFAPSNVEAVASNCGAVRIIARPEPPYEV
nr:hypothetical protein [Sphingomonas sp.]